MSAKSLMLWTLPMLDKLYYRHSIGQRQINYYSQCFLLNLYLNFKCHLLIRTKCQNIYSTPSIWSNEIFPLYVINCPLFPFSKATNCRISNLQMFGGCIHTQGLVSIVVVGFSFQQKNPANIYLNRVQAKTGRILDVINQTTRSGNDNIWIWTQHHFLCLTSRQPMARPASIVVN